MNVIDMALSGELQKRNISQKPNTKEQKQGRKKIIAASAIGSAAGIAAALAGVYTLAKKGNPSVSLKNFTYNEKDILMIGAGSIAGGLTAGLLADKNQNNKIPK